ncbi:MAG: M56 family metallopeptidase, partial [Lachnospiraceae bacterium]|nr:M56 family metallopeptidase [Lachnospiraceae bacterium]
MRAKWRKAIWAILALQLLLWHLLFLEKNTHLFFHWKKLAILIWLISAVFVMALHYWSYVRFRRYCINRLSIVSEADIRANLEAAALETGLRGGKNDRSFLYRSGEVREPFLIGFKEPILILPDREYNAHVLHFIFLHECYHMRHRDMLYKLFMLFIQSLLWFQPLVYLLKAISYQDVEVACDEAVVEGKDISARKEYGYALLECLKMERVKG